jgi:hypothetical protein
MRLISANDFSRSVDGEVGIRFHSLKTRHPAVGRAMSAGGLLPLPFRGGFFNLKEGLHWRNGPASG